MDDNIIEWKTEIENNFKEWIENINEIPEIESIEEPPDIYSFYKELCIIRNEMRKSGRRNQDILTKFSENLFEIQDTISKFQNKFLNNNLDQEDKKNDIRFFLPLIEFYERMTRLNDKFNNKPKKNFFNDYSNWNEMWENFKQGFEIVFSYLEDLIEKEGISKIKTIGEEFNPLNMSAVAFEYNEKYLPNIVTQEISPGFLYKNTILKLAEVKVNKQT